MEVNDDVEVSESDGHDVSDGGEPAANILSLTKSAEEAEAAEKANETAAETKEIERAKVDEWSEENEVEYEHVKSEVEDLEKKFKDVKGSFEAEHASLEKVDKSKIFILDESIEHCAIEPEDKIPDKLFTLPNVPTDILRGYL